MELGSIKDSMRAVTYYQGVPVQVQSIDGDKASVRYLDREQTLVVPAKDLVKESAL
jgi:hypothetical protein